MSAKEPGSLWNRATSAYVAGTFLSQSGTFVSATAQSWVILAATHDPLKLGLFTAARFLPSTLLAPVIGNFVDGRNARSLVVVGNLVQCGMALLCIALAFSPGSLLFVPFLIAGVVSQVFSLLEFSGRQAFLSGIVPDELRARFTGATNSASTLGRIVGPAIAGLVLSLGTAGFAFALDAISFVLAVVLLPRGRELPVPQKKSSLRKGLRLVLGLPEIRDLLLIFALVSLISFNVATMIPLLAGSDYLNSPAALGAFNAAFGLGSFAGGLMRTYLKAAPAVSALIGLVVFGATFALAGLVHPLWAVIALIAVSGIGRLMFTASSTAVLILGVSQERRGLVSGLYAFVFNGTTPVGALIVTALAESAGTRTTFVICGVTALLGSALYAVSLRARRATTAASA
ncbi:MFS family permease [Amycolatopsis bartoniae]|uniref:MFS transporter n=1 Tax=Amycolatopsis bartoniae TaxID=941986 RepID=A0A8H9MED2_9PSEU|nr:MFS transporter [Amycolatopsis bartoniae]MBB2935537.1 MFS family permease [Amycolatopsis bartoniae]TVT03872.1 MFS transporter [Amycolatopsis bartoniae]GHF76627.1 MFS transporter [Amycolatopsis bartoniae]